jgi:hypothetical protein
MRSRNIAGKTETQTRKDTCSQTAILVNGTIATRFRHSNFSLRIPNPFQNSGNSRFTFRKTGMSYCSKGVYRTYSFFASYLLPTPRIPPGSSQATRHKRTMRPWLAVQSPASILAAAPAARASDLTAPTLSSHYLLPRRFVRKMHTAFSDSHHRNRTNLNSSHERQSFRRGKIFSFSK